MMPVNPNTGGPQSKVVAVPPQTPTSTALPPKQQLGEGSAGGATVSTTGGGALDVASSIFGESALPATTSVSTPGQPSTTATQVTSVPLSAKIATPETANSYYQSPSGAITYYNIPPQTTATPVTSVPLSAKIATPETANSYYQSPSGAITYYNIPPQTTATPSSSIQGPTSNPYANLVLEQNAGYLAKQAGASLSTLSNPTNTLDYPTFGKSVAINYDPTTSSWRGSYVLNGQTVNFTKSGTDTIESQDAIVDQLYHLAPSLQQTAPAGAYKTPISLDLDAYGTNPATGATEGITGGGYTTTTSPSTTPTSQTATLYSNPITGKSYTATVTYNPTTQAFTINGGNNYTFNDYLYTYTASVNPTYDPALPQTDTNSPITITQVLNPDAELQPGYYTITDANGNLIQINNNTGGTVALSDANKVTGVTATIPSVAGLNPYSETLPTTQIVNGKPTSLIEENPSNTAVQLNNNTAVQLNNVPVTLFGSNAASTTTTIPTGGTLFVNQNTGQETGFQPYTASKTTIPITESLGSKITLPNAGALNPYTFEPLQNYLNQVPINTATSGQPSLSSLNVNPVEFYQNVVQPLASYIGKTASTITPEALSLLKENLPSLQNQNTLLTGTLPLELMLSGKLPPSSLNPYLNSEASNIYNYLSGLPTANYNEFIQGLQNVYNPINKYGVPLAQANWDTLINGFGKPQAIINKDFLPQNGSIINYGQIIPGIGPKIPIGLNTGPITTIPIVAASQNLYAGLTNAAGAGLGKFTGYAGGISNFLSNPSLYTTQIPNELKYLTTPTEQVPYEPFNYGNYLKSGLSEPGYAALENLGTSNYNELVQGINNVYNGIAPYVNVYNPINKYGVPLAQANWDTLINGFAKPQAIINKDFLPQGNTISSIPIGGASQNLYAGISNSAGNYLGKVVGAAGGISNFLSNLGAIQPYTVNPIVKQLGQPSASSTPFATNPAANQFYQQLSNFPTYYSNASQFGPARTNIPVTNPIAYNPYGNIVSQQFSKAANNIQSAANMIPVPYLNQFIGSLAAQPFQSTSYLTGTQQNPMGTAANLGILGLYLYGPEWYKGLEGALEPSLGVAGKYATGAALGAGGTELFGLAQGQQPTATQLEEGAALGVALPGLENLGNVGYYGARNLFGEYFPDLYKSLTGYTYSPALQRELMFSLPKAYLSDYDISRLSPNDLASIRASGEFNELPSTGYMAQGYLTRPIQDVRGYYANPSNLLARTEQVPLTSLPTEEYAKYMDYMHYMYPTEGETVPRPISLTPEEIESIRTSGEFNRLPLVKGYYREFAPNISEEARQIPFAFSESARNPLGANLQYGDLLAQQAASGEIAKGYGIHIMDSSPGNTAFYNKMLDQLGFQVDPTLASGTNKAYAVYSFIDNNGEPYYLIVDQGSGTHLGRGRGYYVSQPIATFDMNGELINKNTAYNYAGFSEEGSKPSTGSAYKAYGTVTPTSINMPYVGQQAYLELADFIKQTGVTPDRPEFFDAYEAYAKNLGLYSYPRENTPYRQFSGYGENQGQANPGQVVSIEPNAKVTTSFRNPKIGYFGGIPYLEDVLAPYQNLNLAFGRPEATLLEQTGFNTATAYQRVRPTAIIENNEGGVLVGRERIGYDSNDNPIYSDKWSLPGGGLDNPYEDPIVALNREIQQEFGITVNNPKYEFNQPSELNELHNYETPFQNQQLTYSGKPSGTPQAISEEIIDPKYVKLGDETPLTEGSKQILDRYYNGQTQPTTTGIQQANYVQLFLNSKAPVFDLDNTLVGRDGQLRPGALDTLQYAVDQGKDVKLWTHSTYDRTNAILQSTGLDKYFDINDPNQVVTREGYEPTGKNPNAFKDINKIGGDLLIDNSQDQIAQQQAAGNSAIQTTSYKQGGSNYFGRLNNELTEKSAPVVPTQQSNLPIYTPSSLPTFGEPSIGSPIPPILPITTTTKPATEAQPTIPIGSYAPVATLPNISIPSIPATPNPYSQSVVIDPVSGNIEYYAPFSRSLSNIPSIPSVVGAPSSNPYTLSSTSQIPSYTGYPSGYPSIPQSPSYANSVPSYQSLYPSLYPSSTSPSLYPSNLYPYYQYTNPKSKKSTATTPSLGLAQLAKAGAAGSTAAGPQAYNINPDLYSALFFPGEAARIGETQLAENPVLRGIGIRSLQNPNLSQATRRALQQQKQQGEIALA